MPRGRGVAPWTKEFSAVQDSHPAVKKDNYTFRFSFSVCGKGGLFFMQKSFENQEKSKIFTKQYWRDASMQLGDIKMLTMAALIVALRVVVKFFKIPLAPGLNISLDAYVNSLGSIAYGPVVGLLVGAVSDVIGCIVTGQMGEYFLPFILVEMSSSFIFGLFFWRRKINFSRVLTAKFTVNLVSNIVMTSLFNKWYYYLYFGVEKAQAYNIINGARIAKNLILFPLEATIIVIVLTAALPVLSRTKLVDKKYCYIEKPSNAKFALEILLLTAISVTLVLLYVFFLKDFISNLNIKFW